MDLDVQAIGGRLADSEAAWQFAEAGSRITGKADREKACTEQARACLREWLAGDSGIAAGYVESVA